MYVHCVVKKNHHKNDNINDFNNYDKTKQGYNIQFTQYISLLGKLQ